LGYEAKAEKEKIQQEEGEKGEGMVGEGNIARGTRRSRCWGISCCVFCVSWEKKSLQKWKVSSWFDQAGPGAEEKERALLS